MTSGDIRIPNNSRIIATMDIETLLAYAKKHVSLDSIDLINALVIQLEARVKLGYKDNGKSNTD